MARRYVSDNARANWSLLTGAIVAVLAWLPSLIEAGRGGWSPEEISEATINTYLVAWPSFGIVYLVWTHRTFTRQGARDLVHSSREERRSQRRWWASLAGMTGPSSWTLSAAMAAVILTIVIAQDPVHREDWRYIALGLLSVATSWALMVYAFALQYLRLGTADDGEHLDLGLPGPGRFDDYLTLAVLLSTMAATVSATVQSRQAWRVVRANVAFAFVFNTVIVAMMVSLLFGGLVR